MPHPSRFGLQPAQAKLLAERWSVNKAAQTMKVGRNHLQAALYGRTAPSKVLRERLSELLDVPLGELFTAEALAAEYDPTKGVGNSQERLRWAGVVR